MILDGSGSIFQADAEALVDPVNCLGTSGAGLARDFKSRFPDAEKVFVQWCRSRAARLGQVLPVSVTTEGPVRLIYYFPTKDDWRNPSSLEGVTGGLRALVEDLSKRGLRSIAIPALGCGLGGLQWTVVRPLIELSFEPLSDVRVVLFGPDAHRRSR